MKNVHEAAFFPLLLFFFLFSQILMLTRLWSVQKELCSYIYDKNEKGRAARLFITVCLSDGRDITHAGIQENMILSIFFLFVFLIEFD